MDRVLTLNTGAKIPLVGLGTWKAEPSAVGDAVEYALTECGYRHVDCAPIYGNEPEVGAAFKKVFAGEVRREDAFVTSKLWNSEHAREKVRPACEATLRDLGLEYLDLYLMHWGFAHAEDEREDKDGFLVMDNIPIRETWEAMEELVEQGLVKAIGVANFTVAGLMDLLTYAKIKPAVDQIEIHPYLQKERLIEFCKHRGVVVTAYSPLGRPDNTDMTARIIDDLTIVKIAEAHKKTSAQVLIRWAIQRETVAIPKSTHPAHIKENIDVFDFALSTEEMSEIAVLGKDLRLVEPYRWGKVPYFD